MSAMTIPAGVAETAHAAELVDRMVELLDSTLRTVPQGADRTDVRDLRGKIAELAAVVRQANDRAQGYSDHRTWESANTWYDTAARAEEMTGKCSRAVPSVRSHTASVAVEQTRAELGNLAGVLSVVTDGAWAAVEQAEHAKRRGRQW